MLLFVVEVHIVILLLEFRDNLFTAMQPVAYFAKFIVDVLGSTVWYIC